MSPSRHRFTFLLTFLNVDKEDSIKLVDERWTNSSAGTPSRIRVGVSSSPSLKLEAAIRADAIEKRRCVLGDTHRALVVSLVIRVAEPGSDLFPMAIGHPGCSASGESGIAE